MTQLMLGVALTLTAPGPKEAKADPLEGVWQLESIAGNGRVQGSTSGVRWEFASGGKWIVSAAGSQTEGRYKVDNKAKPQEIDLIFPMEMAGGKMAVAIYKVDGDRLTIAMGRGDVRPTTFEVPEGKEYHVRVFRRVKKD